MVLVAWVKGMGCRGIPITLATISDYAADIAGRPLGCSWVKGFCLHHPDIKVKWTTGLEKCHARALNHTVVSHFFDKLKELMEKYDIPEENIYNMDEKGNLFGVTINIESLTDVLLN